MIGWGVAGPGAIARSFARSMARLDDGEIVAVASRSADRAESFGDEFGVPARYGDYGALATDPDVEAVYVATPHSRHEIHAVAYLRAGKHVLCEKPFALNAGQAERMVAAARDSGVFLMEAVWSRFLPSYRALVDVLASGRIGEPLLVEADFGFRMPVDPAHRLFDPLQGGGALLDLGIYPIQLCTLVLGAVDRVAADGVLGETQVDETVAAVLRHGRGGIGVVKASIRTNLSCTARISGTEGWIDVPAFMHCPTSFTVNGGDVVDCPFEPDGLQYETAEAHRCIAEGLLESPTMPLAETVALATTMDEIRSQLGLTYPGEDAGEGSC